MPRGQACESILLCPAGKVPTRTLEGIELGSEGGDSGIIVAFFAVCDSPALPSLPRWRSR
jgi:hypothetical protein